ncbi:MAG: ribosome maturation factor RimM [Spirochaetes bacterium]|nr:ribosome maturation factor RimM [Spirochaetota bacterium]
MMTSSQNELLSNYLKIGFIRKPHGLKGEVKILPLTDNPQRFKKLKKIYIELNNDLKQVQVKAAKVLANDLILQFEEFTSINEVEQLRNCYLYIDRADGVKLEEWEYYSQDLIGCDVVFKDEIIGKVTDLLNTGANDNLAILTISGKEVVYPFLRHYLVQVDIIKKVIEINQYEGFFD